MTPTTPTLFQAVGRVMARMGAGSAIHSRSTLAMPGYAASSQVHHNDNQPRRHPDEPPRACPCCEGFEPEPDEDVCPVCDGDGFDPDDIDDYD